jgi:hypothetical protein
MTVIYGYCFAFDEDAAAADLQHKCATPQKLNRNPAARTIKMQSRQTSF